jgi:hypothetical protein
MTGSDETPRPPPAWRADLARHAVALISLAVALLALGYNTWRNESTEAHRNQRAAAFLLLEQLGEFQQLVDSRHFGGDLSESNRIGAWGKAALVRDIASLVSPRTGRRALVLFAVWERRVDGLGKGDAAAEREISAAVAALRAQVLMDLHALR